MKYIIMEVKQEGMAMELPFIFQDNIVHAVMADAAVKSFAIQWPDAEIKPVSAGFISSMNIDSGCYGQSESLKLKSRKEDDKLIQMCDYGSIHK